MNPAEPSIPGSREARVNGLKIHYHDVGPRDGMPLVLLHGFMTSSYSWRDVWKVLGSENRLYIVDLPGYGKSDCPRGPQSVNSFSLLLKDFFQEVQIGKAAVAGAQMGGTISAWFAAQNPGLVTRLIVIAAGGMGERRTNLLLYRLVSIPILGAGVVHLLPRRMFVQRLRAHYVNQETASEQTVNEYYAGFKRTGRDQIRIGYQVRMSFEDHPDRYASIVRNIGVPTLLIWGEDDPLVPISTALKFQEVIRGSTLVTVPRCGSFPHEEYPATVANLMVQFLKTEPILAQ